MKNYKIIGKRNELGMSQTDMARKLGIATNTYCKKENGQVDFNLNEAKLLCDIFNCKFEDIFLSETTSKTMTEE